MVITSCDITVYQINTVYMLNIHIIYKLYLNKKERERRERVGWREHRKKEEKTLQIYKFTYL